MRRAEMQSPERVLETVSVVPAAAAPVTLAAPVTVGQLVGKTLRVWWRRVLLFTAMSAVVYAPIVAGFTIVWSSFLGSPGAAPSEAAVGASVGAGLLVTGLLAVIQVGAVTYTTIRQLEGERAALGEMLRVGLRRALPVWAVGLLVGFAIVLGLVLLLVPALLVMTVTCVAIPAAVVEKPGVFGAIRRSLALTRGHRWSLFAAGSAVVFLGWMLGACVQLVATIALTMLLPPERAMPAVLLASQLGNVAFAALPLVGVAVAYHDLRVAKEGVDTVALARVFE